MKLKTTEKGFTLIEVLVALAIMGAIMTVASAAVVVITRTSTQNNEWNFNLRQVQNAGHWISRDALMAQVVAPQTGGHFPLTLSWTDWDGNSDNVVYILDGNTHTLRRQLNGGANPLFIADCIDPAYTTYVWDAPTNKLIVTIRASLNGVGYVERIYEIFPRTSGGG